MANVTRLKDLQDSINQLKNAMIRLEERTTISDKSSADIQQQIDMLASSFGVISSADRATSSNHVDHGGVQSRSVRLDFPTYDGEDDPLEWLFRVEQFFIYHNTSSAQRLLIVSFHLKGPALHWYKLLETDQAITSWEAFSRALTLRFDPTEYDDPAIALFKLRQQTTIFAYQKHFEILATKVEGLSEKLRTAQFISGLKDELRYDVQLFKPASFSVAAGLAHLLEQRHQVCRKSRFETVKLGIPTPSFTTLPIKRLSLAEMRERQEKGLCYNCDEKYSPSHKCKMQKIFLLDAQSSLDMEEPISDKPEVLSMAIPNTKPSPTLSINAIQGTSSPQTMKVFGVFHQQTVLILMGSELSHSFITPELVKRAKIRVLPSSPKVSIANSEKISCLGKVLDSNVKVQDFQLKTDFFLYFQCMVLIWCWVLIGYIR
ncbi:hypothetical protein LWI29_037947 [Acer saccharum]|uniref:Retrotransposon gag domain-containing protein n=1 Tax=Acer saccharum TaxID=4024 RepID=A0AA39RH96_ACESA|nr:hypothetical protein LWI29_037947 [Acer saccharum]